MRTQRIALISVAVGLAGAFMVLGTVGDAQAIPAFSRQYRTSCATCHVAFPKLNAFGEAFRNQGYRMPGGDEAYAADEPVKLGAEPWKRMWPDAIWPGDIPYLPPVSLLVDSEYAVEPGAHVSNDFRFPSDIALLAGGNFGDMLSFFGRINLAGRGEGLHVHRFFGQLNNLFDTNLLNVRFGQIEPRAAPFSANRRLTAFDYVVNTQSFPLAEVMEFLNGEYGHADEEEGGHDDGHAHGGDFTLGTTQKGVEVWGVQPGFGGRGGLEYAFGVVNGNGAGDMAANGGTSDVDSGKDVFWRLSYKFGGLSLLGDVETAPTETKNWRDDSFRVGTFGYRGSTPYEVPHGHGDDGHGHDVTFLEELTHELRHMGISPHGTGEDFTRIGLDAELRFKDLNVFGAYLRGETRLDPFILDAKGDFDAWFAQADYVVFPWLISGLRYENVDLEAFHTAESRWVTNVSALVRANTKLSFDAAFYPESDRNDEYLFRFCFVF